MTGEDAVVAERGPFEMVPHWLLLAEEVSALGVRLYLLLRRHANEAAECFPSRQRLAQLLGVSLPTLDKARTQLAEVGAVCMAQRKTDTGAWTSTVYHVHWERRDVCDWSVGASQDSSPPLVKILGDPSKESSTLTNTHRTKTQLQEHTPDAFDEFWKAYPRKVGKKDAQKAWQQAVKDTDADHIIAGALRYRDDPNREDAYTAHPGTWLRAGRWDDDPLPARATGTTGGQNRMRNYDHIYRQINSTRGEIEQ